MVYAIIPAAGSGTRMQLGPGVPAKQFLPFGAGTVLTTTVQSLWSSDIVAGIIVAVPAADVCAVQDGLSFLAYHQHIKVIAGGQERQQSVRNGVQALPANAQLVVVHDGVRPLVKPDLIRATVQAARDHGAAAAALPVTDTVKRADDTGNIVGTVDRTGLWTVQTPQAFRRDLLVAAHQHAADHGLKVTDDAALVEALGKRVRVVVGDARNIKITRPQDIELARAWLAQGETQAMRVGIGYDVHRLVADRPLILGGIEVPHTLGLLGHSDADVLTHAVMDALLGAAALGDIGQHFPDTDQAYKGASSIELLKQVVALLKEKGYEPVQLDSVLAAQRPRLAPYIVPMRESLAAALGLPVDAVGIKATTAEGLGFVGREEGMEARVVATIRDYRAG